MAFFPSDCDTCSKAYAQANLVTIPSKLLIQWSDDLDANERKIRESITAVAWTVKCKSCYQQYKLQEIRNVQETGSATIICVGSKAFDEFCDKYSDTCKCLGIASEKDEYGLLSVLSDKSGCFIKGKYEYFSTLQFFTAKGAVKPEEKKEAEEKTAADVHTKYKTGAFDVAEITVFMNFIELHKYRHQYAIDKWLNQMGFAKYALQHGQLPREKMTTYSRL